MKKFYKHSFLAPITFIALLVLLATQVIWLFEAAKLEQKSFKMRVNKALVESRDAIANRAPACNSMMNYLCGKNCMEHERKETIAEIDSIIQTNLQKYNIEIKHTFEIINDSTNIDSLNNGNRCFLQSLNGMLEQNGIQLRVTFPNKAQFIIAQLKGVFLIAFIALLFVAISFYVTFKMFHRQQKMLRTTTDFINNMVHEFQTPISNIKLATNLIRKQSSQQNNPKIDDYTGIILKENNKLLEHVNEILNVAENGENSVNLKTIDIHELITYTAADFEHRIESLNGSIEFNFNAEKYTVEGNRNHYNLIFSNLIDNAIKYSITEPTVKITTFNKSNHLIVEVQDWGIGIAKNEMNKIFERYYRVSTGDVHNVKGFGLGLAYVLKMVKFYQGTIKVTSTLGKGSNFKLSFPIK